METCHIHYSPFLKCGHTTQWSHDGKKICLFHMYHAKKNEECCICLDSMSHLPEKELIMLSCGHLVHFECLSKVLEPVCPMCRTQMSSLEATKVFYPTVIEPLVLRLYSLPPPTVKCVLNIFRCVLYVATYGYDHVWWVWYKLSRVVRRIERNGG